MRPRPPRPARLRARDGKRVYLMADVILLSPWFPVPADNGARLRAFHITREIARRHRVRAVVGLQNDAARIYSGNFGEAEAAYRAALPDVCEVRAVPWSWYEGSGGVRALLSPIPASVASGGNEAFAEMARQAVAQARPDVVCALTFGADPFVPRGATSGAGPLPAILDEAEVGGWAQAVARAQSPQGKLRARLTGAKAARYWRERLRRYDHITAVSAEEVKTVRNLVGTGPGAPCVTEAPNGVGCAFYDAPESVRRPVPGRLIYNGALTYGPNREAVLWFVREILERIAAMEPAAHLFVTGRYDESDDAVRELRLNARVTLTGFAPDLRPILAQSAVCVTPLLEGGGTRLKILEAWAARLPVVSTTVGALGLGASDGEHLLIADDAETFARQTVELLRNPSKAQTIAQNARERAERHFDWSAIGETVSRLLEQAAVAQRTQPKTGALNNR